MQDNNSVKIKKREDEALVFSTMKIKKSRRNIDNPGGLRKQSADVT